MLTWRYLVQCRDLNISLKVRDLHASRWGRGHTRSQALLSSAYAETGGNFHPPAAAEAEGWRWGQQDWEDPPGWAGWAAWAGLVRLPWEPLSLVPPLSWILQGAVALTLAIARNISLLINAYLLA